MEQLLGTRAEGNPFFAEQILLYLQEEALLVSVFSKRGLGKYRFKFSKIYIKQQ